MGNPVIAAIADIARDHRDRKTYASFGGEP